MTKGKWRNKDELENICKNGFIGMLFILLALIGIFLLRGFVVSPVKLTAGTSAEDLLIQVDGDQDASIILDSDGTSSDAIKIYTTNGTNGGIDIDADDEVTIDCNDIAITTDEDVANAIYLHANGGTSETIQLHADQGTGATSIYLKSDAGGIRLLSDGASAGDIDLDCEDDMTLTAAGDLTLAVTGTLAGGGATMDNFYSTTEVVTGTTDALTAAQSGNMIIYTMTGGACTATLPEATAATVGMWFFLIDGNATAGNDLTIDPEGVGQINGDTAGHYLKCENDRDGEGVLIFSTAADVWYTMACGSSTVWTEE